MKKSVFIPLSLCLIMLASCTKMCSPSRKDMSPEQVVQTYLDTSLNMTNVKDRAILLNLTTGNLNSVISTASDEVLEKAFVNKHLLLEKYSVVERRDRTPRETEITFELVYRDLGEKREIAEKDASSKAPQITTENTVSVVKEKGAWLIRDVIGKKTEIDFPMKDAQPVTPTKPGEQPPEENGPLNP